MTQLNAAARESSQNNKHGGQARRKTRAPKARTPEPKEIVSGAGQPLDPGVRRELEARLGHDLSRVRVHTDRDSAALTELIGADAVAVGPDLFFGEGKYRPAAEDGRRLLTHELLHTIQAPNPLGALRAGRDLGAVSLPQDAVEREAEQGARDDRPTATTPNATPGWLRYATVDADRFRTERLDPATLVDRLAAASCARCAATRPTPPAECASNSRASPPSCSRPYSTGWRTGCPPRTTPGCLSWSRPRSTAQPMWTARRRPSR